MASSNADRFVVLKGGLALPLEPILLALELEERGFTMTREEDDVLSVQPYQRLTRSDCDRIKRWKLHLFSVLDYQPPKIS